MDIKEIDPNFAARNAIDKKDIKWHDIRQEPFHIYGLYHPKSESIFRRLPADVAGEISNGVAELSTHTSGGRVRFSTDSPYIALSAEMPGRYMMSHMAFTGSSGFDLYLDRPDGSHCFLSSFRPPEDFSKGFAVYVDLQNSNSELSEGWHSFTINFPLYDKVDSVFIGVQEGAGLLAGEDYRAGAPFVYYGSSITQGGCASRPGTCYQNFICRRFNTDYLNFGFSGSARGEQKMAEYLAACEMSIFICDYDHNAPDPEFLEKTYDSFYQIIRNRQPLLPYLMITRPDIIGKQQDAAQRRSIIEACYRRAIDSGDRNVYFLDGATLFAGENPDDCTVDSTHPNDLGFFRMAQVIGDTIEEILKK